MCLPCPQGGNALPLRSGRRRSPKRPCLMNHDGAARSIFVIGRDHPHPLDDAHATVNASKYGMLPIQEWGGLQRDEELAAICVGSSVRHRYDSGASVLQIPGNFICKLATVDALSASSRARWVSSLDHKVSYNSMEDGAVVVSALGQRRHVVTGSRCVAIVQLDAECPNAGLELDVRVRLLSGGLVGSGHCTIGIIFGECFYASLLLDFSISRQVTRVAQNPFPSVFRQACTGMVPGVSAKKFASGASVGSPAPSPRAAFVGTDQYVIIPPS